MDKINIVDSNEWGAAKAENIKKVLESVLDIFCDYWGPAVKWHDKTIDIKRVYGDRNPWCHREANTIYLNIEDEFWNQLAYQFAHEYCHYCIFRPIIQRFRWFEETLCELSSYFVLNQLSKRWETSPPDYTWGWYAPNFLSYALRDMQKAKHIETDTKEFHNEVLGFLEGHEYDRAINAGIAIRMLPIFENVPELWCAVPIICSYNDETLDFCKFMKKWHDDVPIEFKDEIDKIAEIFAIKT